MHLGGLEDTAVSIEYTITTKDEFIFPRKDYYVTVLVLIVLKIGVPFSYRFHHTVPVK